MSYELKDYLSVLFKKYPKLQKSDDQEKLLRLDPCENNKGIRRMVEDF